jgi:hypothetical protein
MVQAARVCAEGSKAGFRFVLAADLRLRAQKHVAPDKEIDGAQRNAARTAVALVGAIFC